MAIRNTLICTVGTSLFEGNLSRLSAATADLPDNWQAIKAAYEARDWKRLAAEPRRGWAERSRLLRGDIG